VDIQIQEMFAARFFYNKSLDSMRYRKSGISL